MNCSKCNGSMQKGVLADHTGSVGQLISAKWINEENPEKGKWTGAFNVPDDEVLKVKGYRCNDCGFLELYAFPKDAIEMTGVN